MEAGGSCWERGRPVRIDRGSSPTVREGAVSTTRVSGWVIEAILISGEEPLDSDFDYQRARIVV